MYLSYSSSTLLQIIKQRITMMHPPPQADGTCINHNVNQYHIGSGHNTGIGGHQYHIGSGHNTGIGGHQYRIGRGRNTGIGGHLNHNVNQYHIGSLRGRRQKGREGDGRGEEREKRESGEKGRDRLLPNPHPHPFCSSSLTPTLSTPATQATYWKPYPEFQRIFFSYRY